MPSTGIQCRCLVWLGILAILLHPSLARAQQKQPSSLSTSQEHVCGCPDGRRFAVGAAMFGKNSARVLITGLRPEHAGGVRNGVLPQCTDVLVLGQVVRLLNAPDGRPFLKRESLKRGAIRDVCRTKIHFIEAKKSYDFFADDGGAVTLSEEDPGQTSATAVSNSSVSSEPPEVDLPEDLTGKDLLQLFRQPGAFSHDPGARPRDSAFDEEDLKDGAYFVVRKRVKTSVVTGNSSGGVGMDVNVLAGTLGRIEKRAGARSEPLWVAEVLPDSAPPPFWRSLASLLPRLRENFGENRALTSNVLLASSQIVEINHFFDHYGVDWTRFGERPELVVEAEPDPGTMRLPEIYARTKLSLDENLATAQKPGILDSIQEAALGLMLVVKDSQTLAQGILVLDEFRPNGSHSAPQPDLLRRQCFIGLDRLANSPEAGTRPLGIGPPGIRPPGIRQGAALSVTSVDVKVFRPNNSVQVPADYYAIDLGLLLKPDFSSSPVPLVCRFPLTPIDSALVEMAERILSNRFEIRRRQ